MPGGRRLTTGYGPTPATHLLSNGRYAVMLTTAGSGYSRWHDPGRHPLAGGRHLRRLGILHLRDMHSGDLWSAGLQPSGVDPDAYEVVFNEDRAQFVRRDGSLTTTLEVLVSPRTMPKSAASRYRTQAVALGRSKSPLTPS